MLYMVNFRELALQCGSPSAGKVDMPEDVST